MTKNILTAILVSLISSSLYAQAAPEEKAWKASLGAGVAFKKNMRFQNTYENMDKKYFVKPFPVVAASYGRFSLGVQGISIRAVGNEAINVSAFVKRDGDRYHGLGMTPRKDSVFVGAALRYLNYGFTLSHDINGRSKGYVATFNYAKMFPISQTVVVRAALSLDWLDDKYAEYYYGVRSYEVTASRREYHLNNYFLPGVSAMPIFRLSEKSSITPIISFKILPKKISDSPTMIGKRLDMGGILAYNYSF